MLIIDANHKNIIIDLGHQGKTYNDGGYLFD